MSDMWSFIKRLLGLEKKEKGTIILAGKEARPTEIGPTPPTPKPSRADIRTRRTSLFEDAGAEYPSTEEYARRIKPLSLLELSRRRLPAAPAERKMPGSFANRPEVKKAQANLGKSGYKKDAKIEEDPPRRRRRW